MELNPIDNIALPWTWLMGIALPWTWLTGFLNIAKYMLSWALKGWDLCIGLVGPVLGFAKHWRKNRAKCVVFGLYGNGLYRDPIW